MPGLTSAWTPTQRRHIVLGAIGTVILLITVQTALSLSRFPFVHGGPEYRARFAEVGNLNPGDDVVVAGVTVGSVKKIELVRGRAEVTFQVEDPDVVLGDDTEAAVSTRTLLGKRGIRLASHGTRRLAPDTVIPTSRTKAPYDLTDALAGLTNESAAIDVKRVSKALDTINATFDDTSPDLRAAVTKLSAVTEQVAARDDSLTQLLESAESVTGVLDHRDDQIAKLLADGGSLLREVDQRRDEIVELLEATQEVSRQLSGLVDDNRKDLGPALAKLSEVTALLNRNKRNLDNIITGGAVFGTTLGEALGSTPSFSAYVQNLVPPASLLPIISEIQ